MSRYLAKYAGALALALSVLFAHDAVAASSAKQYKAAPADAEAGKSAAPEGEAGKATPPAPRKRPAPPAAGADAAAPAHGVMSLQCDWLGKRIISLLVRDDPDAAQDFTPFYQRFVCGEEHLAKAFGCAVANLDGIENSALTELIDACWKDPAARMVAVETEAAGDKAEKGGKSEPAPGKPGEAPPKPQ